MRFFRRSLMGLFLLSLTVGLLAWAGQIMVSAIQARLADEGFASPARERVFTVTVVPYVAGAHEPVLTAYGEVISQRQLELRASAPGRVVFLADNFVDGGHVDDGALLMRVDPADAQSALARAQSDQVEAEAEVADAQRALELAQEELDVSQQQAALRHAALARQEDLRARGVGTEAAVETAQLAASAADQAVVARKQALAQAEARLGLAAPRLERQRIAVADAERALADTEIYASFSGTLAEVGVTAGGIVTAGERIGVLTDPDRLEVAFRISTGQYARLLTDGRLTNAPVRVSLGAGAFELTASGLISRDSAVVGEGLTGRLIYASLRDAAGFRPGDFVTVEIEEPALGNVALLPATAVDAQNRVLVLGEDDRLEEAEVEILRRQHDDILVRADHLGGREVVAARTPLLGAGLKVSPLRPDAAQAPRYDSIELTPERRAKLIAFVEANTRMPEDVRNRLLNQLQEARVPARTVERLESRMGG